MFVKDKSDYYNSLKRFWWILLILTSMSGAGGYFYSNTLPLTYESAIKLMFRGMSSSMASYVEIARSNTVLDSVIEKYNLKISTEALRSKLSIIHVKGTEFINIRYRDTDQTMTAIVVNEIAAKFKERAEAIFRTEEMFIFEKARNPEKPLFSDKFRIIAGFIGVGFFIGVLIISLIEFFTKKMRAAQEIENFLEIRVLGSIPDFKGK